MQKSPWGWRRALPKALGQRAGALQKQSHKDCKVPNLVAGASGHMGVWEVGIMSGSKDEDIWLKNSLKNEVWDLGDTKLPTS